MSAPRPVVIGGGIAGLVAAWELARAGRRPILYEARGYLGGLIAGAPLPSSDHLTADQREAAAGIITDIGAESYATRGGSVANLLAELNLASAPPRGSSWVLTTDGMALPIPQGILGIAGLDANCRPDKALATALGGSESAAYREALADLTMGGDVGQDCDDLASFVTARMGSTVLERLVRPVAGGIHSAAPETLAVDVVAPGLRAATKRCGSLQAAVSELRQLPDPPPVVEQVVGGMHLLPEALQTAIVAHGGEIRTRTGVFGLRRCDAGFDIDTAPVTTRGPDLIRSGPTTSALARAVVIACSGPQAMELVAHICDYPTWQLPLGSPIAHLTVLVKSSQLNFHPRGSGMLTTPGAPVGAKALTHMNAKWPWLDAELTAAFGPDWHLLRISYGRHGEPYPQPDVTGAIRDINVMADLTLSPADVRAWRLIRWDGTLAPPTPDHRAQVRALQTALTAIDGVALTGAWVAGSGIAAVVAHARRSATELEEVVK
ncbi:MAG: FAD-dependent oxidoreductase [Bowdeniella nasicola]|nr:FAD-dependent oxidoreductase [Bowdeniella nasicola]